MSLTGKHAIITGGSRGIGAGIADELAKRGAKVLITYATSSEKAAQVVRDIKARGGEAVSVQADCMSPDAPSLIVSETMKAFGPGIDILVNNAGVGDEVSLRFITLEHFDKMFITNVRFPMFLVKECLPHLRKGGRIVNVSSVAARQGWKMHSAYSASKASIESLTKTWAVELGQEYGITVNAVNPGPVDTDMWKAMPPAALAESEHYIQNTPAEARIGTVDDIAQIVAFLCEEGSRWVNGSTTCANGGACFV